MLKVEVKQVRKHGLEVWQVFVAGVYQTEFLSEEIANGTAARIAKTIKGLTDEHTK